MALSDTSKTLISIKKLVGKAHTSNDKDVANEALPTGLTVSSNTIFAQSIPAHTGSASNYYILSNSLGEGVAEFLRLSASFIAGSDTDSGRHGFALQLPDDYVSNSRNPKKGTDPFTNGRVLYLATGSLQLVPPSFDADYEAKPYHTSGGQTQIPVLDARDWNLDYFNGIFFQQDPPGSGDHAENPEYIDAYVYIGEFANKGVFSSGLSGSLTHLVDGTSYITAGANITVTTGSSGRITIAAGGTSLGGSDTQVQFNDDGSFGGDSGLTFNKTTNTLKATNLSGSLTQLSDGKSYLVAGSGMSIASGTASGQITLSVSKEMVFNEKPSGAVNGTNTSFALASTPFSTSEISIFVNGQLQVPSSIHSFQDYSVTGSSINFTTASRPPEGSIILAIYNKVI